MKLAEASGETGRGQSVKLAKAKGQDWLRPEDETGRGQSARLAEARV